MQKNKQKRFFKAGLWVITAFMAVLLISNVNMAESELSPEEVTEELSTEELEDYTPTFERTETQVEMRVLAISVPEEMEFAGERVPLEIFDVRERLDRELIVNTYWHSNTMQLMKLANRYFPTIEFILYQQGIPEDFKYLALVESGLRHVVSPMGAAGYWQFLAATGREYGLEVNDDIDERYHLEKSTVAATKYLKKAYERFGSWTMAAASYNIGMPRLSRIAENQLSDSYYDLHLNQETSRYVFRILALKEIFSNPEQYGFHLSPNDLYEPIPYETVKVDSSVTRLAAFANAHDTNFKTLKILNPWIRGNSLVNPRNRTYHVKIPLETHIASTAGNKQKEEKEE